MYSLERKTTVMAKKANQGPLGALWGAFDMIIMERGGFSYVALRSYGVEKSQYFFVTSFTFAVRYR